MPVPSQPILRFDEEVSELVSGELRQRSRIRDRVQDPKSETLDLGKMSSINEKAHLF
jgi:hypothetical protein